MINGITPKLNAFFDAVKNADMAKFNALLQDPEIVANITASDGISPNAALRIAQENEHDDLARELFKYEAVEEQAAQDTIKELSQVPPITDNAHAWNNNLLRYAAKKGNAELVQQLLLIPAVAAKAATFDCWGLSNAAIYGAAANGHTNVVKLLLTNASVVEQLCSSDYQGENRIIRVAAQNGHTDVVNELLKVPSQSNADHYTAFREALGHQHLEIAYRLLMIPAIKHQLKETIKKPINLGIIVIMSMDVLDGIIKRARLDKMKELDDQVQCQKLKINLVNELMDLANECGANIKPHLDRKRLSVLNKYVEQRSLSDIELRLLTARGDDTDTVTDEALYSQASLLVFDFRGLSLATTPVSSSTLFDDYVAPEKHGNLTL